MWKDCFKESVASRGFRYYLEGRIIDYSYEDPVIEAVVIGRQYYQAKIILEQLAIKEASCGCD